MNVMAGAQNSPIVYVHVTPENSEGRRAIQYWIYYYYNRWWNKHEGDWEMVQVELDSNGQPDHVTFAQQVVFEPLGITVSEGGSRRPWENVERVGDHPVVYPGLGSHGSYFYPATYSLGRDETASASGFAAWTPTAQLVSIATHPWLEFAGRWCEKDFRGNNYSGPATPARHGQKWTDPLGWSKDLVFDENAGHQIGKIKISVLLNCTIAIKDTVANKRWGTSAGKCTRRLSLSNRSTTRIRG